MCLLEIIAVCTSIIWVVINQNRHSRIVRFAGSFANVAPFFLGGGNKVQGRRVVTCSDIDHVYLWFSAFVSCSVVYGIQGFFRVFFVCIWPAFSEQEFTFDFGNKKLSEIDRSCIRFPFVDISEELGILTQFTSHLSKALDTIGKFSKISAFIMHQKSHKIMQQWYCLSSCSFDDQLSPNFHRFVILCIKCWET